MDIVYIRNLRVDTLIGVFEWERREPQRLWLDLEIAADTQKAAASDDLADAVDYKAVAERVSAVATAGTFHLVETLAEEVARLLLQEFGAPWVRVGVNKRGALACAGDVGVTIERGKRP